MNDSIKVDPRYPKFEQNEKKTDGRRSNSFAFSLCFIRPSFDVPSGFNVTTYDSDKMCFKDLLFLLSSNESDVLCESLENYNLLTGLYAASACSLILNNIFSLYGITRTKNRKAKWNLLHPCFPSLIYCIICLIAAVDPSKDLTGQTGMLLVVLFGFGNSLLLLSITIAYYNIRGIATSTLRMQLRDQFHQTYKVISKYEPILFFLSGVVCFLILLFHSILFPLAPPQTGLRPYWISHEYNQRDFYWDLGIFAVLFEVTSFIFTQVFTFYLVARTIRKSLLDVSSQTNMTSIEFRKNLVVKLELGIAFGIIGWSLNFSLFVCFLYISNVGPRYYLIWLTTVTCILYQLFEILLYAPKLLGIREYFGFKNTFENMMVMIPRESIVVLNNLRKMSKDSKSSRDKDDKKVVDDELGG